MSIIMTGTTAPTLSSKGRFRFLSKTTSLDIICRAVTISLMATIPYFFMLWRSPGIVRHTRRFGTHRRSVCYRKRWHFRCRGPHGSANSRMYDTHLHAIGDLFSGTALSPGNHCFREYSRIHGSSSSLSLSSGFI